MLHKLISEKKITKERRKIFVLLDNNPPDRNVHLKAKKMTVLPKQNC